MDDTSSLSAICCEYQFPQIFENLSSFPMKWWVLKKYIHWSSFEFCTDGVCWWLPFFNGYNFYSQDFLVGDVESGECFQIHEMSNWNPSGALWASIALCCVLQPILHNDSQSCCIFFSSLETCSPFLPMNHKLCLLQKPLHHFFAMYWVVDSPSVICLGLSQAPSLSTLHHHMYPEDSPSHAEQQSSSQ